MGLTRKQQAVYNYISDYIDDQGISPTQQEIKEHFGFKSLGSVQDYLRYLKDKNLIQNDPHSVRGLTLVKTITGQENSLQIPLHGKVAAGRPIEAMEQNDSFVDVPSHMIGHGQYFALTISGDSMIEDGILDQDVVVIKKQNHALNGQTVVALLENEATIKRYYKKEKQIELQPANSTMAPIIVTQGNISIQGVLVGLLRSY